jgi:transmembrane sensor
MTNGEPFIPKRSQLRDEAAEWFAVMHGPDADARRSEFNAWLARGAVHREAYNRIGERFSQGKDLSREDFDNALEVDLDGRRKRNHRTGLAVGAALFLSAGVMLLWGRPAGPSADPQPQVEASVNRPPVPRREFATTVGEIRTFRLDDGSAVTLDTDSLLSVAFNDTSRFLRLERGRARFDVAHEARAFVVSAGNGTITARGTLFDVRLDPGNRVSVHLLRGAVDVVGGRLMPIAADATVQVQHLKAGEEIAYSDAEPPRPDTVPSAGEESWPTATQEFDGVPLSSLVTEANRYSAIKIVLAPELTSLKVSGTFRIDDTRKLAERLALLFDLTVRRTDTEEIVLSPKTSK